MSNVANVNHSIIRDSKANASHPFIIRNLELKRFSRCINSKEMI